MINWYKFLLKEELKLDPNEDDQTLTPKFSELWKTNEFLRKRLTQDLASLELLPAFKSMIRMDQHTFFKVITKAESFHMPPPGMRVSPAQMIQYFIKEYFQQNTNSIISHLGEYITYCLFRILFNSYNQDVSSYYYTIKERPLFWLGVYKNLYSKYPDKVPVLPEIKTVNTSPKNKEHNLDILEKTYHIDITSVYKKNILDDIRLVEKIGSGYYGNVYSTEDGRAFKVFSDGVDLKKDINRMRRVINNLYKGSGKVNQMAYFETGKIGYTSLFYAIMPEIVPLKKAPFFDDSKIFYDTANYNKVAAKTLEGIFKSAPVYKKYKDLLLARLKEYVDNYQDYDFDTEYNKYSETIERIIEAGYRAYKDFKGADLHSGNIGYLRQKPDEFFYFDM